MTERGVTFYRWDDMPKETVTPLLDRRLITGDRMMLAHVYLKKGCIWCFTVNRRWVRDANVGGNVARFINHACKPNCYSQIVGKTIWIRAGRNIAAGEELTYDYYTDGERIIQCRCRPGCKRTL